MAKFRYSLNAGTSWTVVDAALPYSIPSTNSQDVLVEPIGAAVLNEKPPVVVTAPAAFAANQWTVADAATGGAAKVTVSAMPSDGGSAITAIQYKVGNGAWTNSGAASTGTFNITGLTNGASVNVLVRAVNAIGNGADSDAKSVTPTAAPAIPFTYDSNTYWWDFAASDNMVDNSGVTTLTQAKDKIGDKATILNYNKAWQPLKVAGGITFNQATNRFLTFNMPPTISNGKNGWYVAFTLTPTTATSGVVMSISGPASTVNSRMYIDFTGSRNIRLRFGANDSTTLATLFTGAALTLGQKYAIEILFDFDADTYTLWINGVNQNVTVTGGPWSSFPASNPREVLIGNFTSGALSLDAVLNNIVFQDGVPSSDIRSSVSAFQQTRQAA